MTAEVITDADRYPGLSSDGARLLQFMREHPHAPIYRNQSGHRLNTEDVAYLRDFERSVLAAKIGWQPNTTPNWVAAFIDRCRATVPFYRQYPTGPHLLEELRTIDRGDLSHDIAAFYPDDLPLDRIINFRTSGTSGHPLLLASHPRVAGSYLAFHKRALQRFGLSLKNGRGQMGVVLVGYQEKCFTYVSVTPTMDESGLAKLNLHPADWRDPADRAAYLDALNPEVYTGDPLSFAELMKLPLKTRPRVMISTSMALSPGLQENLQHHFQCPVLDLYSMNEAGPIAVADPAVGGHVLLQPDLYVEILDPQGQRVAPGERGEVTLTGGFNFCLPLLRYRTGDYASLNFIHDEPVLVGLEGRPPIRFQAHSGEWKNNIEVTHALRPFSLVQFVLHQRVDRSFSFRCVSGAAELSAIRAALAALFGSSAVIALEAIDAFEGKVIQYTSDLPQV